MRLYLLSYHVSEFALDYTLSMLPNHSDFATILGPTVPGPGPGGSNLPPSGGGSNLPPTVGATTNPILASIQDKLVLQAQERKGLSNVSIYSNTAFTAPATLATEERTDLGLLVGHDESNGTSGVYNTVIKKNSNNVLELRVVTNYGNKPLSGALDDVASTASFRLYLTKFS